MKALTITRYLIVVACCGLCHTAKAQNASGTATQNVQLALSNTMDISFVDNNSNIGNLVSLQFDDFNDYANGIESAEQMVQVRSNEDFDVRVEAASSNFIYTGNATSNTTMSVSSVLKMKVSTNNTGGNITGGFSNYKSLSTNDKKIINKGDAGNSQTFGVKYKATPGFSFPSGTYTVDVIFTITEH